MGSSREERAKLLVVSHTLVGRSGGRWLTFSRVGEIVDRLVALGWEVTVVGREGRVAFTTYPLADEVRVIALRAPWTRRATLGSWAATARALWSMPRVLVFMPSLFSALCVCVLGRRAIVYTGGSWGLRKDFPRWRARLELLAAQRASALIVAGDALLEHFRPHARAVELCVPHVHHEVVERLRDGMSIEESKGDALRVLFVGGVNPLKGVRELLVGVETLPDVEFRVVGQIEDETLGAELARAAATRNNLLVEGYQEWDKLREHYIWANVLALPSHTEGFPRVAYEAVAFGLALVLTPVGGIAARLIDGVDALLVDVGHAPSLLDALRMLAANPERRRVLAQAARATLSTSFTGSDAAEQLQRALRRLPSQKGGKAHGARPARRQRATRGG
jgi:glycosyltransferase involved in cell wall biosynthesis